ncbi:MAG: HK97 family phage prohead protease [Armatimonadota bacterium]
MPQIAADRRSYKIELRSITGENGQRRIEGHAAVFNSLSEEIWGFREIIKPGAFANAIVKSDVRALWNHNPDYVLGRTKAKTLTIAEDDRGLAVNIIPPDTQFARDLMTSMDRGDIDQMSFAFTVKNERWYTVEENGESFTIREITEVGELFDVSPVTYPAYKDTDVSARTKEALKEYRDAAGAGGPDNNNAEFEYRKRELDILDAELIGG